VIDAYLAELDRALALPRRVRRRIVAEAHDHLDCAAAAARAEGSTRAPPDRTAHRRAPTDRRTGSAGPGVASRCDGVAHPPRS
jgi:hypothetical protein